MDHLIKRFSMLLAALGILVSAYMTIYKLTDNQTMCLGNGGCSVVNSSVYAEVYGIPVAAVGLGGFAAILGILIMSDRLNYLRTSAELIVFGLALIGFLFTLYLIYVEVAMIRALCPFCIASQAIMIALFALSVTRLARDPAT